MENTTHRLASAAMIAVNFLLLAFLTTLLRVASRSVTDSFMARSFLESLNRLPHSPAATQLIVLSCFALLVALSLLQAKEALFRERKAIAAACCLVQIGLCLAIMGYLDFQCNGILFLPMASIIVHIEKNSIRVPLLIVGATSYLLLSFDILVSQLPLNAIDLYMQIYSANTRSFLYGVWNMLVGLNVIIFIIFMILALQRRLSETVRLKELNARVSRSAEELKVINLQLEEYALQSEKNAQTRERNRIAREIHDTLGHTLTSIATAADACIELAEKDPKRLKEQLVRVSEVAREGLVDVRRSVSALRPDALERFSLSGALSKMVAEINATTGIIVELSYQQGIAGDEAKEIVYRIVQESITNSVRHGAASRISVDVSVDGPNAVVNIADNGKGCNEIGDGFGLAHMRERIEAIGGTIAFDGSGGFVANAVIPCRRSSV